MTEKERYKAAFSHLHASGIVREENKGMKHRLLRKGVAAAAVAALTLTAAGAANAATDGALVEKLSMMITVASVEVSETQQNPDGSTTYYGKSDDGSDITVVVSEEMQTQIDSGEDADGQVHLYQEDGSAAEYEVQIREDGTVAVREGEAAAE